MLDNSNAQATSENSSPFGAQAQTAGGAGSGLGQQAGGTDTSAALTAGGGGGGGSAAGDPGGGVASGGGAGGDAGGGTAQAAQVFSHFADKGGGGGAAAGGGGAGGGGGPAKKEEAEAQANSKPTPHAPPASDGGDAKGGAAGATKGADGDGAAGGDKAAADMSEKSHATALPADIVAAFPDADLSGVAVHMNSKEAAEQGVDGFANADEIHVAPGADAHKTLMHEAAHVVQFRSGKKKIGGEPAKADSKEKNEEAAKKTEAGGKHSAQDLGTAAGGVRFKESGATKPGGGETNLSEKGVPKVVFNGMEFKSVEGEVVGELAKADWNPINFFDKETWWRIPAFPAAGLYVRARASFDPAAKISMKGGYKYEAGQNGDPGKFQVTGTLEGELSGGVTGSVEGGAGINLVLQRGGVGLQAALTAQAYAKLSRSVSFWVDTKGNVGLDIVPIDVDIGAVVKGALNAAVWTEGWFYDARKTWTLAEMTIATLAQYKTQIGVSLNTKNGVKPTIGAVQGGKFTWGEAPNLQ